MLRVTLYFLLCCMVPGLSAQDTARGLTLENIYTYGRYPTFGYWSVRWMPDHEHYSSLEWNSWEKCAEVVRTHAKSGEQEVVAGAGQLTPSTGGEPLDLNDYAWSADQSKLLLFTHARRVWRYETRGDYWVLDLGSGALTQLGKNLPEASLMFAKFSPDGKRVAYVSGNNMFVEDLDGGKITQLTEDGGDRFINGTFDWLYEEEFHCRDGFRWSHDGKYIAYWHTDTEGTGIFYLIDNLDSLYSFPIPLPYPKVGTTNSSVRIGVVPAGGGETRWLEIPGDPRNHYLVRMDTVPGTNEVMIQQLNRLQNTNRVWIADLETVELKNILTEKDEAFLDVYENPRWLDGAGSFVWISERDGWRHLYQVSKDGSRIGLLTRGDFDVVEVAGIAEQAGKIYYIASPDDPTRRYLYESPLNGKGKAKRVSPADQSGWHSYRMSDDAHWALHTFENAATPPLTSLISVRGHRKIRVLLDNWRIRELSEQPDFGHKEFFRVDIGQVELDAWMIRPADFDPGKKYPVIFHVYGEPGATTVKDDWSGGDLWHRYLALQGFVVMSVDNRGTDVPRGRAWRKSIYRQIGILATDDQAAAAQKILDTFAFLDRDRVGIWGWSGGGSMTLNCLFRYPGIYRAGIAVAFVSDQKLYDTAYQERYMGLPEDNPKGYRKGSPITHASGLQGELLLIHGTADDNCHYQSFEKLVNELVKQDKQFQMMSYPMRTHSLREGENTFLHLHQTMERFWKERL
jgi:dipeptidyl-peptidase-4